MVENGLQGDRPRCGGYTSSRRERVSWPVSSSTSLSSSSVRTEILRMTAVSHRRAVSHDSFFPGVLADDQQFFTRFQSLSKPIVEPGEGVSTYQSVDEGPHGANDQSRCRFVVAPVNVGEQPLPPSSPADPGSRISGASARRAGASRRPRPSNTRPRGPSRRWSRSDRSAK